MDNRHDTTESFTLYPIGYVETRMTGKDLHFTEPGDPALRKQELRDHLDRIHRTVSVLNILPEYGRQLTGLESFSHIHVLFWPHQLSGESRGRETVHPRGWKDLPEQGVFATHSPARPNPVLTTTVRLVARDGLRLSVTGLDALDGTPVIDIKPLIAPETDLVDFRVPDWVRQIIGP